MSENVFFFGYSWNKARKLDAYQAALVQEFTKKGYNVHVYYSNLFSDWTSTPVTPYGIFRAYEDKLIKDIKKIKPKFVLSMNQGLLSQRVCEAFSEDTQVYTWIVDDPAHLFYADRKKEDRKIIHRLPPRVKVIVSSSDIYKYFQENCQGLDPQNLLFVSSVTDFEQFRNVPSVPQRNIVFVGTHLDINLILILLRSSNEDQELRSLLMSLLRKVSVDYNDETFPEYKHPKIVKLIEHHKINFLQFKMCLSNLISTNLRENAIRKLKDLGVQVFGNVEWMNGLRNDLDLLDCYQSEKILSRKDLVNLYQQSKISIQVTQLQVARALSYRVFDILASDSLLIHPYHEHSDFYHFFGKDCPVPFYKDLDELYSLCKYYLENEEERLVLVKKCQNLVRRGYSFIDRVDMILGGLKGSELNPIIFDLYKNRISISSWGTVVFIFKICIKNPWLIIHFVKQKINLYLCPQRGFS